MAKIKPFKGWPPVPILPAAQVQATSYAQHLAYIEWYLDYIVQELENLDERVSAIEEIIENEDDEP